jgi:flagellar export protein FliJ
MRRFRFRFQAVKVQRGALLDAARQSLAEVLRRRQLAVDLMTQRRQELAGLAARGPAGVFDVHREALRQRRVQTLHQELERRQAQLGRLEEEVAVAREKVAEAHRGLRAMEIIEERDRAEWLAEAQRMEQSESDERASQQFGR